MATVIFHLLEAPASDVNNNVACSPPEKEIGLNGISFDAVDGPSNSYKCRKIQNIRITGVFSLKIEIESPSMMLDREPVDFRNQR